MNKSIQSLLMQYLQSETKHFSTDRLKKPMLCSCTKTDRYTLHNLSRGDGKAPLSLFTGVVQYKLEHHLWPSLRARKEIDAGASSNHCATQESTQAGGLSQWLTKIDSELLHSAKVVQTSLNRGESWVLSCLTFSLRRFPLCICENNQLPWSSLSNIFWRNTYWGTESQLSLTGSKRKPKWHITSLHC